MSEEVTASENLAEFFIGFWNLLTSLPWAAVIAGIGIHIAYQQLRTNRDNLRERLFDRRWNLFKKVQRLISDTYQAGAVTLENQYDLKILRQEAKFLFGQELQDFLNKVEVDIHDLKMLLMVDKSKKYAPHEEFIERGEKIFAQREKIRQGLEELFQIVQPYIGFEKTKLVDTLNDLLKAYNISCDNEFILDYIFEAEDTLKKGKPQIPSNKVSEFKNKLKLALNKAVHAKELSRRLGQSGIGQQALGSHVQATNAASNHAQTMNGCVGGVGGVGGASVGGFLAGTINSESISNSSVMINIHIDNRAI